MKNTFLVLALCGLLFCVGWGEISSHGSGWQLLRSVTAVDNPALAAATMDGRPAYATSIKSATIKGIELIVAATGSDNGVVVTRIWCGKGAAGPARLIGDITWTLGTMACNKDPQTHEATTLTRYADTAVVTPYWPLELKVPNSGNNLLCTVSFDALDADWIAVEVITLTNATRADVFFGYFD